MQSYKESLELRDNLDRAFQRVARKADRMGLKASDIAALDSVLEIRLVYTAQVRWWRRKYMYLIVFVIIVVALALCETSYFRITEFWFDNILDRDMESEECTIMNFETIQDLFRPPVDCGFCRSVTKVDRVSALSKQNFESKYAYRGHPVVVSDGMTNWTASQTFSFEFLKSLYGPDSTTFSLSRCQFFPYKSGFRSLQEVFSMEANRLSQAGNQDPWYIGWSNCDSKVADILRQHYQKPYFLPDDSESSNTDWLFMGTPGYGAHMHIDRVGKASWQAQVTGTKRWILEPPPECAIECGMKQITVDVSPNEIIVIDTDAWYHQTLIIGDELSITIGSEYD